MNCPISILAKCLHSAHHQDLPDVPESEFHGKTIKAHRPPLHTIEVLSVFKETWESTALGFGGMGGQAITPAYTVIITSNNGHSGCVYRGGRLLGAFSGDRLQEMIHGRSSR